MNAERLLEVYEQISEAPDTIRRMRRFVLDLAVRGKLVEQDPRDEPASVLMKATVALKAKEGVKIKDDPLQPSETPFQAPVGWLWTRVGVIALQTGSGSTPRGGKSAYADEGTPFLRSQNVYDDGLRLDDVVFINDETNQKMKRTQVKAKDLLLNITGGSIGRCTRIPDEFPGANVSQHVAIIRTAAPGTEDYLHLLIRSPFFQEYVVGEQTGAGRGGLPKNRMDRIPVPLPPLAEQHRIVAKVDELMALCDRLEEARKTREEVRDKLTAASLARLTAPDTTAEDFPAHAAFALEALPALTTRPDQIKTLRQTILNLAVRGKLVEQNPTDEPVSVSLSAISAKRDDMVKARELRREKPLNPIQENDAPFQIPSTWRWVRVGELALFTQYGTSAKAAPSEAGIPVLTMGNIQNGVVVRTNEKRIPKTSDELPNLYLKNLDLLYNRTNSAELVGKTGLYQGEDDCLTFASYLIRIRLSTDQTSPIYVNLAMNTPDFRETQIVPHIKKQTGQANVSGSALKNMLIPLPPLAEQHRIVAKVEALMALCDRLEAALTNGETTRTRLLEALLHEALEPASGALEAAE